ncbi:MAG TPA: DUF3105 domain-containing protein [Acidimicrobiales bacterium]|nr:DUF3105 domain-containing protein [Acidimicrobiales bacterium]
MPRRLLPPAAALLLVASLGACAGDGGGEASGSSPSPSGAERIPTSGGIPEGPAPEGIEGVIAFTIPSRNHTEAALEYDHLPPAGGDHFPVPSTCGFYSTNPPPTEMIVHDLEHGAIWVAYRSDVPEDQLDTLRELAAQETKFIATPFDEMDSPITVTAWARQLPLDDVGDPRLRQFIDTYRNGPEAPEPGAACQGVGDPEVPSPSA